MMRESYAVTIYPSKFGGDTAVNPQISQLKEGLQTSGAPTCHY